MIHLYLPYGNKAEMTVDTVGTIKVGRIRNFTTNGQNIEGKVDIDKHGNLSLFGGFCVFDTEQLEMISGLVKEGKDALNKFIAEENANA